MEFSWMYLIFSLKVKEENSWMQDPRYKHEYLDRVQNWATITGEDDNDESDKHASKSTRS